MTEGDFIGWLIVILSVVVPLRRYKKKKEAKAKILQEKFAQRQARIQRRAKEEREIIKNREQRLKELQRLKQRITQEVWERDFKKCPDCAEDVKREAKICKHCRYRWK